jgi:hypothetical protein
MISRRNLFRKSLGLRTLKEECLPKEPVPTPAPDEVITCLAAAQDVTPEKSSKRIATDDPAERLRRLLEEEPAYVDIFRMIREFCPDGRSISEIEYLLLAHPMLQKPKIYPSYLVDRLEFAGALEWTGKWQTTETGKNFPEL